MALLAIFGLSFAPTVSHALARVQGQPSAWTQICTPQGMKTVAVQADDVVPDAAASGPQEEGASLNLLEHCPLCGLAASALPLPAADGGLVLPLSQATEVPRLFLRAPRPLFIWSAAQPRAPPAGA